MAALTNCGHAQCAGMLLLDFRKWDKATIQRNRRYAEFADISTA
jgi:hypothetical protein